MEIQWYPGHMTKTRRMIQAQLGSMDAVCEILDARIPRSSRNPDVDGLTAGKPRLVVLNRADQADREATKAWAAHFKEKGWAVLETDSRSGAGTAKFAAAVRELLSDKLRAYAEKGQTGRVAGRPPKRRTDPASPGPSSGSPLTGGWSCWTPPASSGPSWTAGTWACTSPSPAR